MIYELSDWQAITDPHAWMKNVREAAIRHAERGGMCITTGSYVILVTSEMYTCMGEAVLFALEARLGDQFCERAALAWSKAFGFMSATMVAFAKPRKNDHCNIL
jgi:hemoglobin-like flavoprotein